MTYRTTWFGYVIWLAYAGLCVLLLAFAGWHVAWAQSPSWAKAGAFLIFPVLIGLYLALRRGAQALRKKCSFSAHAKTLATAFVVSASFVFGLLLRIRLVLYRTAEVNAGEYVARALVRAGEGIEPLPHGVSYLYVRCLSAVFSFLGNSVAAAMLFQALLQLLAMLFGYLALRVAAGRFAACFTLLLMAFSEPFTGKIWVIDPECFYLVLYLFGLYAALSFARGSFIERPLWRRVAKAVSVGLLLGLLIWLDLWSATLFLFLAWVFLAKREREDFMERLCDLSLTGAFSVAGFLAAVCVDGLASGISFGRALHAWSSPYAAGGVKFAIPALLGGDWGFFAALFMAASFLALAFVKSGKEQDYMLWVFACVTVSPLLLFDFWPVAYGSVAFVLWSAAASLGVKNCLLGSQTEAIVAKIEEINGAVEAEEKPRFIENPLPLPKKHVKRELDFDYEVAPESMRYDVEVAAGEEFPL